MEVGVTLHDVQPKQHLEKDDANGMDVAVLRVLERRLKRVFRQPANTASARFRLRYSVLYAPAFGYV